MDCPQCTVELAQVPGDDGTMHWCGDCGGLWVDASDMDRILLHANLPALSGVGGLINAEEMTGQCPACNVDLVAVEGGEKRALHYDTCEACGGIWLEGPDEDVALPEKMDWKAASTDIVAFYRRFMKKK